MQPWQVLSETTVIDHPWLHLREQRVRLANGHEIDRFHLISAPDWSGIVAVTDTRDVVMVRQYRHGIGRTNLELPAGVIEPREEPLRSAQRELREETGYTAREWHALARFATEPARHTTTAHFFVALGASLDGAQRLDSSEMIEVERVPERALLGRFDSGEILHGVQLAALLLAAHRGFLNL